VPTLRLTLLVALVALASCGGSNGEGSGRRSVVASFYPLAFALEQVGAQGVDVTNLTPAGAEPHDIELTARDVARIRDADVVFYLGAGFQPAVEDAIGDADGEVVDVLDGIRVRAAPNEETRADPHVWLDPTLYSRIVKRIGDVLGHPIRAGHVESGLARIDAEFERGLANCRRREIVTSHEAFGYLAARYDLKQVPIAGLSPEAEPTPRQLENAIDRVRASGATTIFFETLVSPRIAQTIARETGAKTAVLDPIEGLTDEQIASGDDYFTVMRRNLRALRSALQCR
jgi:zinc transport system substrate-binding protein